MPVPLPASQWDFDPSGWPRDDAVAVGADLEPPTLLAAYRSGAFPMPLDPAAAAGRTPMVWWSPQRRGVLHPDRLHVSRSLRASLRRYQTRLDTDFAAVVAGCADPRREGGWISADIQRAYLTLHALGWAHSVETYDGAGRLVGGLYGLAIGGLFAGESMFHRANDASKVALVALTEVLCDEHVARRLVDVQWCTPHLRRLGVEEVSREAYLARLPALLETPLPAPFAGTGGGG